MAMFEYSCSESKIANWLLQMANQKSESIFPYKKGWRSYVTLFYPHSSQQSLHIIAFCDKNECVAFVPLDKSSEKAPLEYMTRSKIEGFLGKEQQLDFKTFQLVFVTSEKYGEFYENQLGQFYHKFNLLVLGNNGPGFRKGEFANTRLEFRMCRVPFDPDMISEAFPPKPTGLDENMSRTQIFQGLFHRINHYWMNRQTQIALEILFDDVFPIGRQLSRVERKKALAQVKSEMDITIAKFFKDSMAIVELKKKPTSHPKTVIRLMADSSNRRVVTTWSRNQSRALEWLRANNRQIQIEIDDFEQSAP